MSSETTYTCVYTNLTVIKTCIVSSGEPYTCISSVDESYWNKLGSFTNVDYIQCTCTKMYALFCFIFDWGHHISLMIKLEGYVIISWDWQKGDQGLH